MFDSSWRCPYCDDGVIYCPNPDDLEASVRQHIRTMHPAYENRGFAFEPGLLISEEYMSGRLLSPWDVNFLHVLRIRWNPPSSYKKQLRP